MLAKITKNRDDCVRNFGANSNNEGSKYKDDTLLKNNFSNRTRIAMDKFTKAFTVYPAKGITGSKNSNFYEFLTMGTIPYLMGSITLMSIFNTANKHFSSQNSIAKATKIGNKMALGVIFYALAKEISKSFINIPVKLLTGIDTELPYAKVIYLSKEKPDENNDQTSIEYHKVGESVDFPRWDLLYGDPNKGEAINKNYDKIAQINGLGNNLNDSDQEVKPLYKEVLVKSKFAKSISTYLWAATGVAFAMQDSWNDYLKVSTLKFWNVNKFKNSLLILKKSIIEATKTFLRGELNTTSKIEKHAGKILLGSAILSTIFGIYNTTNLKKHKETTYLEFDTQKERVVC